MLYDQLLAKGKLEETWESKLSEIKVFSRNRNSKKELVVQFNRIGSKPQSVFIFFDENGEYSGSNFTGD